MTVLSVNVSPWLFVLQNVLMNCLPYLPVGWDSLLTSFVAMLVKYLLNVSDTVVLSIVVSLLSVMRPMFVLLVFVCDVPSSLSVFGHVFVLF